MKNIGKLIRNTGRLARENLVKGFYDPFTRGVVATSVIAAGILVPTCHNANIGFERGYEEGVKNSYSEGYFDGMNDTEKIYQLKEEIERTIEEIRRTEEEIERLKQLNKKQETPII